MGNIRYHRTAQRITSAVKCRPLKQLRPAIPMSAPPGSESIIPEIRRHRSLQQNPPRSIVTDGLRAYSAAMNEIGVAAERHEVGGRLNNRAENSHQPFRRRERAMQRFRSLKTLQKFSSVHAQVHNQFNQERHLVTRQVYKQRRSAALAEWRALAA